MQKSYGRSIYLSEKILLAFVGLPASGKSTAINAVKHLGRIITMGDVIREEASSLNQDPSAGNIGKIARDLRNKFGEDVIAQRCIEKIRHIEKKIILIDGIRSMIEVKRFREHWKLFIIAIKCPDEMRIKRIKSRGRSDDTIIDAKILERDKRETEFGLNDVIKNADFTIMNDKDKDILISQVQKLVMEKILI